MIDLYNSRFSFLLLGLMSKISQPVLLTGYEIFLLRMWLCKPLPNVRLAQNVFMEYFSSWNRVCCGGLHPLTLWLCSPRLSLCYVAKQMTGLTTSGLFTVCVCIIPLCFHSMASAIKLTKWNHLLFVLVISMVYLLALPQGTTAESVPANRWQHSSSMQYMTPYPGLFTFNEWEIYSSGDAVEKTLPPIFQCLPNLMF